MWSDYVDPVYKENSLRIVRDEKDGDKLFIKGKPSQRIRRLGGIPFPKENESVNWDILNDLDYYESYRDSCHPAAYDPTARLQWMDDRELDISILFPSLGLIWTREVDFDPNYIRAHMMAYNRWIMEFSKADAKRLIPVAQTCLYDQQETIRDLQWLKKEGFENIMLPLPAPDSITCFHSDFDDFWAAVQDLGLVVHLHKVAIPNQLNIPAGKPLGIEGNGRFFTHVNEILAAQMCLSSMMDNRLPDRFPKIKYAFLECNAGWVPAWLDRSDESYEVLQSSKNIEILKNPPRHYLENTDSFFFSLGLSEDVDRLHSIKNNLLIATDFPHPGGSVAPVRDWSARLENFDAADKAKIMGQNAVRMLNRISVGKVIN
ncbi:MAG: amidohydrolase [Pyrinomonadaceae bacterium]|nr:amidohydrolase [Pyrinomonadaceae bacterium]